VRQGYKPSTNPEPSYSYVNGVFRAGHSGVTDTVTFLAADDSVVDVATLAGQTPSLILLGTNSPITYFRRRGGIEIVLRGALAQPANKFDQYMADGLRNFRLPALLGAGVDIIGQGIYRARDSGSLTYETARVRWGMPSLYAAPGCAREGNGSAYDTLACFTQLTSNLTLATELRRLYFQVSNMDMDVGAVVEPDRPGSPLGELTARITADQFTRVRDGDRFWFENPGLFTPAELEEIHTTTFADVLLRFTTLACVPENPFVYTSTPICKTTKFQ
jgi:peroxidase